MISPDRHVRHARDFDAGFVRELRARTIFVQPRHRKPAIARNFFGVVHRDRQFVLQGFPTTRMRTSAFAFFSIAFPCPTKILPLIPSKSLRSMPALRGTLPTS